MTFLGGFGTTTFGTGPYGVGASSPSSTPTSLTMPSVTVEIAFQNVIDYAAPAWTDVTKYVLSANTQMGRQHELQQVQPSTASIVLTNQDGRFSPWNTNSPYYYSGNGLTPGHPIKIKATWQGFVYDIFTGYIKSFVPTYGAARATMTVACYDWLALLNFSTLDVNTYKAQVLTSPAPNHYWQIADAANSTSAADSVGSLPLPVVGTATFATPGPFPSIGVTAGTWSQQTALYSSTATNLGSAWTVEGWVNTTITPASGILLFDNGSLTSGIAISGKAYVSVAGGIVLTGGPNLGDGKWHYIAATGTGTTCTLYVDGSPVSSGASTYAGTGGTYTIVGRDNDYSAPASSFAQVATYTSARSATQIATQYVVGLAGFVTQDAGSRAAAVLTAVGVPSAFIDSGMAGSGDTVVQGSTSSLATTTAMSYLNTIMASERGVLYQNTSGVITFLNRHYPYEVANSNTSQYTFGYASGELRYHSEGLVPGEDDIDLWNNVNVGRNGGVTQNAFDATSQSRYGRRTMATTGLLFLDDLQSNALAQGMLSQYKDARARVRSMTVDSTIGAGAALPAMLGLDLLDRITINWRPIDGSTVDFSQQSLVEQITHNITPEKWTTTFAVTPIGTETFWRLNLTALDNTVPTGLGF